MIKQTTQHEKIVALCKDEQWHCGNAFRELYIFSPHKRRSEIQAEGKYTFEERKCIHGHRLVKDYRMTVNGANYKKVKYFVPMLGKEIIKLEKIV